MTRMRKFCLNKCLSEMVLGSICNLFPWKLKHNSVNIEYDFWLSFFAAFCFCCRWLWLNKHTKTMTTSDKKKLRQMIQDASSSVRWFRSCNLRGARGWNTLLVFALSARCYLNIKVNRSANEMLFCLAFCEVSFLPFLWIQISNWTTMRSEGASRFDFFLFLSFTSHLRGLWRKLLFSILEKTKGEKETSRQTSRKWMENFLVLWFLNWQFECNTLRFLSLMHFFLSVYRTTCGSNGIFSRRLDFSLYNVLPKQRINSIEVKVIMEISFTYSARVGIRNYCNYAQNDERKVFASFFSPQRMKNFFTLSTKLPRSREV